MAGVWKAGWVSGLIFLKDMSLKCACRLVFGLGDKKRHSWTCLGEALREGCVWYRPLRTATF